MEFISGTKIGKLTLLEFLGRNKHSKKEWLCQCECGNTCVRVEGNLKNTAIPHCGCSPAWKGTNKRFVDLTGQRFGILEVVGYQGKDKYSHNLWICKCDCGNAKIVDTNALRNGKTKSCGCIKRELLDERNTSHNLSDTRIYRIYNHMKDRCFNKENKDFQYYGGKGVTVCDEWKDNFQAFYDWSVANGYADDLTIERNDVDGNYEPSNCKWATIKEQANNKTTNVKYEFLGEVHTLSEWSEIIGVNYHTLYHYYLKGSGNIDNILEMYIKN